MRWNPRLVIGIVIVSSLWAGAPLGRTNLETPTRKKDSDSPQRALVLDGRFVHNVGELHMHVTNAGWFGSAPGTGQLYSEQPSAMWPAGSGVEYLFIAGLWVGAMKSNVPAVTTAVPSETYPTTSPIDIIYEASEGVAGGNRLPSRSADDDGDGLIDEDWLNGHDDDGDGAIDEDFAAVSKQMFSCWYDDYGTTSKLVTDHNPLNIHIRQESYQWEESRFDDFVGINFWVTNMGDETLEDVYIGFFADSDAGPRGLDNYYADDGTGMLRRPIQCTDLGPVSLDVAYTFDVDGDGGRTPGYFGMMFLGHTTDPTGEIAPNRVGISTYASFSGREAYENGGDPVNDAQRYELLSQQRIDRDKLIPRDYRMLVSAGPFNELLPGSTLVFQTAFVAGAGLDGMRINAASAQLTYNGAWFNLDGDNSTGIAGRETPVMGPANNVVIDSCIEELALPFNYTGREPIWINNDCVQERLARERCGMVLSDSLRFMTGVAGRESHINWIVATAPPPPNLRINDLAHDGVEIYWDNFSESVPDVKTLEFDFEGYRVWRADGWNRPIGTTVRTGPGADLWQLLFRADVVNNLGEDTGLDAYRYAPLGRMDALRRADLIASLIEYLNEHPGQDPPCPQGVAPAECDTLLALAQWELRLPGGRQYYRYVDRSVHRGRPYFYAVTADDHEINKDFGLIKFLEGKQGDPASNFVYVEPRTVAQSDYRYDDTEIYVVPNPATVASMQPWALGPNNNDPTGIKIEFRNLPADRGTVRVYTIAGDLVAELPFDGTDGNGTIRWDLVSRSAQDITSGVYLYSVTTQSPDRFRRKVGKFVIIR